MHRFLILLLSLIVFTSCASMPSAVGEWREDQKTQMLSGELTMAYKTFGSEEDPVVVLLHGLPTSSYLYREIAPTIAAEGYYVITPDLIGFGASSKPNDLTVYDLEPQAERLAEFFQQLQLKQIHLVVHDLGGLVGFRYLVDHADAVASLVVLNTTAYEDGFNPPKEMSLLKGAFGPVMTHMMRSSVTGKSVTKKFINDNRDAMARAELPLSKEDVQNYWWPIREGATHPMVATAKSFDALPQTMNQMQQALKSFAKPSSILWGTSDSVLNGDVLVPQFQTDLKTDVSDVSALKNAGHFVQLDQPENLVSKLLKHLEQYAR